MNVKWKDVKEDYARKDAKITEGLKAAEKLGSDIKILVNRNDELEAEKIKDILTIAKLERDIRILEAQQELVE